MKNIPSLIVGILTGAMAATLTFMTVVGKIEVPAYTTAMLSLMATWMKVDFNSDGKPDINQRPPL